MPYLTPKVEYPPDPLSVTTPAWTDITASVQAMSWFSGKQKDLDQPEAGGAVFVLKNTNRDFEPTHSRRTCEHCVRRLQPFASTRRAGPPMRLAATPNGATVSSSSRSGGIRTWSWDSHS